MKTTIIATDNTGIEERLPLDLNKNTALRLLLAEQRRELKMELNEIMDECYNGHFDALTPYQYHRLKLFDTVINNVFYNYNLELK